MASQDNAKIAPRQARTSSRPLAARMPPVPAGPDSEPHPTAAVKQEGQRLDDGEKASNAAFIEFSLDEQAGPAPKQGRSRRRYEPAERLGVAATRRRGACGSCRALKIKCLHDSSKMTTDQYQSQSESHERFALGLTTPSLTANEDEHKQVMEEKIAALDGKLVKAQENPPGRNCDIDGNGSCNAAGVVAPLPSPARIEGVAPPTQKDNNPAVVHRSQTRQKKPIHFKQGLGKFKVDDYKSKHSSPKQPNKVANATSYKERSTVCQLPRYNLLSETLPGEASTAQRFNSHVTLTGGSCANPKTTEPGCKSLVAWTSTAHSKATNALPLKSKPDYLRPGGRSDNSEEDSHTMVTESMLSFGRSPSPFSDRLPSNPPSYVHLSEVERLKSHDWNGVPLLEGLSHEESDPLSPDMDAMDGVEPIPSFEAMLNSELDLDETFQYMEKLC